MPQHLITEGLTIKLAWRTMASIDIVRIRPNRAPRYEAALFYCPPS